MDVAAGARWRVYWRGMNSYAPVARSSLQRKICREGRALFASAKIVLDQADHVYFIVGRAHVNGFAVEDVNRQWKTGVPAGHGK